MLWQITGGLYTRIGYQSFSQGFIENLGRKFLGLSWNKSSRSLITFVFSLDHWGTASGYPYWIYQVKALVISHDLKGIGQEVPRADMQTLVLSEKYRSNRYAWLQAASMWMSYLVKSALPREVTDKFAPCSSSWSDALSTSKQSYSFKIVNAWE